MCGRAVHRGGCGSSGRAGALVGEHRRLRRPHQQVGLRVGDAQRALLPAGRQHHRRRRRLGAGLRVQGVSNETASCAVWHNADFHAESSRQMSRRINAGASRTRSCLKTGFGYPGLHPMLMDYGLTPGVPRRRRRTRPCPGRASWARFRRACNSGSPTPATLRCGLPLQQSVPALRASHRVVRRCCARSGTTGHAGVPGNGKAGAHSSYRPSLTSTAVRAQLVESTNGGPSPTGGSPSTPSGSPSATPSPSSGGGGSSGSSGCSDRPPSQYYTCQQQACARPSPLRFQPSLAEAQCS